MEAWITLAGIQLYKQVSNSVYKDKLNQIILETQFEDIQPLLGETFFYTIDSNIENYNDLLNGSSYTYNGVTYVNVGLKAVLANYIYARLAMFGDVIDNPFGMTTKLNVNESKPIDLATKKTFYNSNRQYAYNLWLNVEKFIVRTNLAGYNSGCTTKPNTFKISKIG